MFKGMKQRDGIPTSGHHCEKAGASAGCIICSFDIARVRIAVESASSMPFHAAVDGSTEPVSFQQDVVYEKVSTFLCIYT